MVDLSPHFPWVDNYTVNLFTCVCYRLHQWNVLIYSGHLKQEGWLYIALIFNFKWGGTILLAIWDRRSHISGSFGEEAPFFGLFEWGGIILLGKFGRSLVDLFYLCPKLCWLEFHFMVHALSWGLVI